MHKLLRIVFACSLLLPGTVVADTSDLASQRALFLQLYKRAGSGDYDSVQNQAKSLRSYALYPYIEAADLDYQLAKHSNARSDARMAIFLQSYPDLGITDGMRSRWLEDLGQRGEWASLLDNYRPTDDLELRCYQVTARIKLGRMQQVENDARSLWLVKDKQPDACDPVFDWMEDSKLLTNDLIESRLWQAMENEDTDVVMHLAKKLPEPAPHRAERWRDLQRHPLDELRRLADSTDSSVDADVLTFGVRKASRADPQATAKLLPRLFKQYPLATPQRQQLIGVVGVQMALNRMPEALNWFGQLTDTPAEQTAREWRIRSAIYQGDWAMAKAWILDLPAGEKDDDRWRYWLARSLEAGGEQLSAQQGKAIYTELAAKRGYYPYLAADRLGIAYSLKPIPLAVNPDVRQHLESQSAAIRARELHAVSLLPQAKLEWRRLTNGLSSIELQQAALLARDWDWEAQAILTLVQADYWDDLQLRYPLLYREQALAAARDESIDPAWVYGILRTESLFEPDARSSSGALGLLQLLPGTARQMAKRTGISLGSTEDILKPGINLHLGAAYLHDMLDRFGGNYALATASYNAGPARVRQWLPPRAMPADVWVENIPFNETRGYVQRVMENLTVFEWRLGNAATPLSKRLLAVNPANVPSP